MTNNQDKQIDDLFQKALKALAEKCEGNDNGEDPLIYLNELIRMFEDQEKQYD